MQIVILDANTLGNDLDLRVFNKFGNVTTYGFTPPDAVVSRITGMDIIITNKVQLNQSNLCFAPTVKLICVTGTGSNNIDPIYTAKQNIVVSNIIGYSTESVAQHTFALLFYLYEHLAFYDQYVKSGDYLGDLSFSHFNQTFHQLAGKHWGIIGMGAIGQRVSAIATAFGCHVSYYSTSGKNNRQTYKQLALDQLLASSDVVSIHAPLNDDTDGLLDLTAFKIMKPSAILLNLGRGRIVNEHDLYEALSHNYIAAAALDVLEHEPMEQNNPLLKIQDSNRLIITPHIGWASIEARNKAVDEVSLNIESFINGVPRNQVNSF